MNKRVMVLGGTGVFGKRLCRHLCSFEGIDLVVTSRSQSAAEKLGRELSTPNRPVEGTALDATAGLEKRLAELEPWAVIDCSGPFQEYNHDVAKAILSAGAHLIDLADARQYLLNYKTMLDDTARANGVTALAGASSTPALSLAAVEQLTVNWQRVDTIDICITPGGKSEVGRSVIKAIVSYAGKEVPTWQGGEITSTTGWTGSRLVKMPLLGDRRVAPVETADAELLGPKYNVTSRVSFSAGLESPIEQWGLQFLAHLRRLGVIRGFQSLIPALLAARKFTRLFTTDRGGMLVEVSGIDEDGKSVKTKWSLLAERDHGPYVPVMAAAAALRLLLEGHCKPGADIATNQLTLAQIEAQMAAYSITTRIAKC